MEPRRPELWTLLVLRRRERFLRDFLRYASIGAIVLLPWWGLRIGRREGAALWEEGAGFAGALILFALAAAWLRGSGERALPEEEGIEASEALETLLRWPESRSGEALLPLLEARILEAAAGEGIPGRLPGHTALSWLRLLTALILAFWMVFLLPGGGAGGAGSLPRGWGGGGVGKVSGTLPPSKRPMPPPSPEGRGGKRKKETETGDDRGRKKASPPPKPDLEAPGLADLVVFPDFLERPGRSLRKAPRIRRAPPSGGSGGGKSPGRNARTPFKDPPGVRFERALERALSRGRLHPWEGRWLHLWQRLLEGKGSGPDGKR